MMKNAHLPKVNILLLFISGGEILAFLCSDDSIQTLLILTTNPSYFTLVPNVWKQGKISRVCIESSVLKCVHT